MNKNNPPLNIIICSWCGMQAKIIWVHGHGQCANCGINIEECCKGETCEQKIINGEPENKADKNRMN